MPENLWSLLSGIAVGVPIGAGLLLAVTFCLTLVPESWTDARWKADRF